jgi:hypothetical protein
MSADHQQAHSLSAFTWETQPQAWALVRRLVDDFVARCPAAATLAKRMAGESGTRFVDWVDSITLPETDSRVGELERVGYVTGADGVCRQAAGVFPTIVIREQTPFEVAIKVDSVADFAAVHQIQNDIEGQPLSIYRYLPIAESAGVRFAAVERHGYRGFAVPKFDAETAFARLMHLEAFRSRRRDFADDAAGFDHASGLIDNALRDGLDAAVVCDLFFAAEREFWMRRNRAARVQYARQQSLGLGWANHDHHTYRSSRANFTRLVALWEKLGLQIRERFYAGQEAGWGAQVMEQPVTGIITFNDVDLSAEELMGDFAHEPLAPRDRLGTVGLWCGLHGDSALQAGMHHLECQFDFEALRDQLQNEHGVKVMKPFTDFPHLRQAFTEGERWSVADARIRRLLEAGLITLEQANQFRAQGAIGSHLENLERNEGFKGFNQTGVSEIIAATDPRRHLAAGRSD